MPLIAGFGMLIHTKSRRTNIIFLKRLSVLQNYNKNSISVYFLSKNSSLGERRAARGGSTRPDEHIFQLYRYSIRGFPPLPEKTSIGVFIPSALCGLALLYIATDLLTASSACLKSISPSLKSHPFFRVLFILSARAL